MFNSDTPNQHSLPSQNFPYHLKLRSCGRQIVQHISWSQGRSTSPHNSEPILWIFIPGMNCIWQLINENFLPLCQSWKRWTLIIFISIFFLIYFYFILFLGLGLGLEWQDHIVTYQSHQMTWSQVMRCIEGYRRFWKDNVIQHVQHMLILRQTHGCLG